ncbi:MAG: HIRAN domain-containing protein [Gemmatimonadota bacterium]
MGLFDWLQSKRKEPETAEGISRRDFFGRFAGRGSREDARETSEPGVRILHRFHVKGFPFYDGPVLVPNLRPGVEFSLSPEHAHPTDPHAIRIDWGRDRLGYVPPDYTETLRKRLADGERVRCRAFRVNPTAELASVLEVEIAVLEQADEE